MKRRTILVSELISEDILTDALGADSIETPVLNGKIKGVHYIIDGTNPLDAVGTFTITSQKTGQTICNAIAFGSSTAHYFPVRPLHEADGTEVADGYDYFDVADEKLTITVAGGGAANEGQLIILVG